MTCNAMGVIAIESGQNVQAMKYYRRANEYQSKVYEAERSAESALYLGMIWENMGMAADSYRNKKKMYLRAEECLKEAYDKHLLNESLYELREVYSYLLEAAERTGDQMLAESVQEKWEKLCVAAVADAPEEEFEEVVSDIPDIIKKYADQQEIISSIMHRLTERPDLLKMVMDDITEGRFIEIKAENRGEMCWIVRMIEQAGYIVVMENGTVRYLKNETALSFIMKFSGK